GTSSRPSPLRPLRSAPSPSTCRSALAAPSSCALGPRLWRPNCSSRICSAFTSSSYCSRGPNSMRASPPTTPPQTVAFKTRRRLQGQLRLDSQRLPEVQGRDPTPQGVRQGGQEFGVRDEVGALDREQPGLEPPAGGEADQPRPQRQRPRPVVRLHVAQEDLAP